MGVSTMFDTGKSGMMTAQTQIATSGHNISNANTEGYSRQRVLTETNKPQDGTGRALVGRGVHVSRIERINDQYLEKQIRNASRDMAHFEEKDFALQQIEDVFNEMNGDGLNRLMSRFFNEFRKLANDPDSEAVRQSVREATQSLVGDFKRIRREINEIRAHIDNRVEGYAQEVNALSEQVRDLNLKIKAMEATNVVPNDLLDQRDLALKKIAEYMDIQTHQDKDGSYYIDIPGVGPLVAGPIFEKFYVERSPADDQGKPENALSLKTTASASSDVTHVLRGGKLGALLEVRDQSLSVVLDRLDQLAFNLTRAVNQVHQQGFTRRGASGVNYFKPLAQMERAAEYISLSDEVHANVNNIATAAAPSAPGDNRVAVAISGLQGLRLLGEGTATADDWYNSIVSDVGVFRAKNKATMNQQKDIVTQLGKLHDQLSGVSIDEETANLLQFQHAFDASAKVIQVADEMLDTILSLKR